MPLTLNIQARSTAMPFKKGQSGNPGGKPRLKLPDGRTLSELAREHSEEAIKALADIAANGESEAARVSAATALLDRAFGRPRQDLGIEMVPDEATAALLEQARKRALEKSPH
jgi:hypothetical protein